jgi:hypothetical protein
MSTLKMLRELKRQLEVIGCSCVVDTSVSHPKVVITHPDGAVQQLSMASSPRDESHRITNAMQEVRRFARKNDGKHPLGAQPPPEM